LFQGEPQELVRDAGANEVRATIVFIGVAAAVAEKTRQRVEGAGHQFGAEYVQCHHGGLSFAGLFDEGADGAEAAVQ
jgi:hypothetical protein